MKRRKAAQAYADDTMAVPFESAPRGVGALLREARLGVGGSIEQIGAALRIRPAYLEAIEDGRSDRLPGPVYALGFVRAYAEHLGLDGAEIVRRFKNEGPGLPERRDLSFPMPLTERSKPGGPVLLVALILAACAYGTWYYLSAGERLRPERITSVPTSLLPAGVSAPAPSLAPAPAAASPAPTAPAASPSAGAATPASTIGPPAPSAVVTTTPATAAGSTTPVAVGGTIAAAPVPSTAPVPAAPVPAAPVPAAPVVAVPAAPGSVAAVVGPPAPPIVAAAPAASTATPAPAPAPVPTASTTAPPAPATAAPRPTGAETAALPPVPDDPGAEGPRVYGVTSGPVRIVVKATADSWIQVKDRDLGILQTRILKPGEIFRVPDRPGIVMRTGNAGGLDVTVDGKPVPSLGAAGRTRNVLLEADRLVAGTAGD